MVAAKFSRDLALSRGGNKTLSRGIFRAMFAISGHQFILPFYHFILVKQINTGGGLAGFYPLRRGFKT